MAGVVWILGAGFSRALGGPLLPDLLSRPSEVRTRGRFPQHLDRLFAPEGGHLIRQIVEEFGWHKSNPGPAAWRDAEEFLEFLDLAAESGQDSPCLQVLRAYAGVPGLGVEAARAIAAAAKRLVAAECCFFSPSDSAYEKWSPYIEWAGRLENADTVITFNYDRVVEEARRMVGKPLDLCLEVGAVRKGPALLKLHGSVDWRVNAEGKVHWVDVPEFAVSCSDENLAIASPGLSKARFVQHLAALWSRAVDAIMSAEAVVFVGYRFPPSDAHARERLLQAVASNSEKALRVHTVLGPERDGHTTRLETLLARTLRLRGRCTRQEARPESGAYMLYLEVHPLFAEDFLGLVSRKELLGHPPGVV